MIHSYSRTHQSNKMMIRCMHNGSKQWESHDICESIVSFVNVKTKYPIDEDLVVEYILHHEFKSSTKDWIGIFPRNWSNLQQNLTFEYTLIPSPNAINPYSRTISFPRIFHREAPLNLEYQFVYVSKDIQIIAASTYFCFTTLQSNDAVRRCSCMSNVYTNTEVLSSTIAMKTEATQQPPTQGVRPTCRYCHRKVCGLKIDALRGDFLARFSDSLLNRVHRLERDLSFTESALKNAKGVRENLARRLQAYEAFVAEMLKSLAVRGVVKITDEKGIEIVLQRVNEEDRLAEGNANTRANSALEAEIVALKRLLQKQQQTIVKLNEQRSFEIPQRDRANCVDREIQTISDPQLTSSSKQDTKKHNTDEILDVIWEKSAGKMIEKNNQEKLPVDMNPEEIETIDTSKLFFKDVKQNKSSTDILPGQVVLKIPKPSGILVQGKDVKFAIVRF